MFDTMGHNFSMCCGRQRDVLLISLGTFKIGRMNEKEFLAVCRPRLNYRSGVLHVLHHLNDGI